MTLHERRDPVHPLKHRFPGTELGHGVAQVAGDFRAERTGPYSSHATLKSLLCRRPVERHDVALLLHDERLRAVMVPGQGNGPGRKVLDGQAAEAEAVGSRVSAGIRGGVLSRILAWRGERTCFHGPGIGIRSDNGPHHNICIICVSTLSSGKPFPVSIVPYPAENIFRNRRSAFCGLAFLAHDAAHDALVPSKRLNHWIKWFSFALIGVDGNLWQLRHNKAHHIIPNVEGADSAVTKNPLVRLSPHQPVLRHHRFQHIYAPLLYGLIVLHSTFRQDFLYLFNRKQLIGLGRVSYTPRQVVEFILLKITYLSLVLFIPLWVTDFSLGEVLLGWFCMTYLVSWLFVWLLIGTHFCEEAEFPEADDSGQLAHNWAYHAMVTSVDWSPHSRAAQFFLGGANAHATHHLFPNVSHTHYRFMSRIIEEEAVAHGVPYNKITLGRMLISHFRFLKRLGRD